MDLKPGEGQIRTMIVDDSPKMIETLERFLNTQSGIRIVGVATTGEDAITLTSHLQPDLVLMDVHMPGINGVEATRIIRARSPQVRVILISAYLSEWSDYWPGIGASGFLVKSQFPNQFSKMVAEIFRPNQEMGLPPRGSAAGEGDSQTGIKYGPSLSE